MPPESNPRNPAAPSSAGYSAGAQAADRSRVLVNVPGFGRQGGVTAFYSAIRPHLSPSIVFLPVGKGDHVKHSFKRLLGLSVDYSKFIAALIVRHTKLVHLNPSVATTALHRDAVFCAIAKLLRRRVLVFFHGWHAKDERILRRLWFIYKHADAMIVLAQEFRNKLNALSYKEPIYCVTTTFAHNTTLHASQRTRTEADPFKLLFLARVEKEKGVYETIDAYAMAKQRFPRLHLTMAGDGRELEPLKSYAESKRVPDLTFTGYVSGEAKEAVFATSDCYILPTYGEGLPCSVLEAMAHGLPIITRPVGGLKDFFEDDRMGFLEPTLDAAHFAQHILRLSYDPVLAATIAEYNRRYALEHFSAPCVAGKLETIYDAVLSGAFRNPPSWRALRFWRQQRTRAPQTTIE
jgi:glycosyltransferase involved in cell wall biosynthesis